jgi:SAM-dependent methyltransferase/pimeloyl-ACP methyl ester carboxylesterase
MSETDTLEPLTLVTPVRARSVSSERIECKSRNGLTIAAYFDQPADAEAAYGYVIISPKYGETKKNNLQLSYHLAANGFGVLRFDLTHHLGESEGEMRDFTLESGVEDTLGCLDWLAQTHQAGKITLLASSLSARMALRAAAMDPRVGQCVCLVGVVSIQTTLRRIYGEDLVQNHLAGKPLDTRDMFGFEIDGEGFLRNLVECRLHNLDGAMDDLSRIKTPVLYYHAERDAWVDFAEVEALFAGRENVRLRRIAGAMHEIKESPAAAEETFRRVVCDCIHAVSGACVEEMAAPERAELFAQNRLERQALQRLRKQEEDEKKFWSDYLIDYEWMGRSPDFREYLRQAGSLLGRVRPREIVLDAGCGNGFFGIEYLQETLDGLKGKEEEPCLYLGLDLTETGLGAAVLRHSQMLHTKREGARPPVSFVYGRSDLDALGAPDIDATPHPHRFASGTFDKICCSLLLSYLKNPQALTTEFFRLLKPGGRLVLSSMKPNCDLGTLFAEFTQREEDFEKVKQARSLLRAAGQIKVKEDCGIYAFFSEDELIALVREAGFTKWEVHRSFGDQVNLLMAIR